MTGQDVERGKQQAYAKMMNETQMAIEVSTEGKPEFLAADESGTLWHATSNDEPSEIGVEEFERMLEAKTYIIGRKEAYEFEEVVKDAGTFGQ